MPKYKLCYLAKEIVEYSVMIESDTPEEAFNKFNDPEYYRGHCEEESFLGIIEPEYDIQIEGEWIADKDTALIGSFSLKRYNEPIKLKQ